MYMSLAVNKARGYYYWIRRWKLPDSRLCSRRLYSSRLEVNDLEREGNALYKANAVLEQLVNERTAELSQTILQLRQQIAETERARKIGQES